MLTHFIEYAVLSARELLGIVFAACIADWYILLPVVAAITLAACVYEFFKGNAEDGRLARRARNAVQAQTVRINLQYDRAELSRILYYVKAHDRERQGRYDSRNALHLEIWTHAWHNSGCRKESCLMFSLEFDWRISTLMSVVLMPGFDWEAFVDELAILEKAALGESIYGRTRHEPTI